MALIDQARQRVGDALSGANEESINRYTDALRDSWKNSADTVTRQTFLIIILGVVFELMARATVSEVSLGPVKVEDVSLFQKTIPLVISYLFYQQVILSQRCDYMQKVHTEVLRLNQKKLVDVDLDALLHPGHTALWDLAATGGELDLKSEAFRANVATALGAATVIAIIGFEIYAFTILFRIFHFRDVLVWISLVSSVSIMVCAFWYFWLLIVEES